MPISQINTNSIANGAVVQADLATGVAGTGPVFRAKVGPAQSGLTHNTTILVALSVEDFDTSSRFNNTNASVGGIPAYAFLPNVAGYYQVTCQVYVTPDSASMTSTEPLIYKNGSNYLSGPYTPFTSAAGYILTVTDTVYMNGSTDYLQFYNYATTTSGTWTIRETVTVASACLVRAA